MKLDQASGRRILSEHRRPALVGECALDEILAQGQISEPVVFQGSLSCLAHRTTFPRAR